MSLVYDLRENLPSSDQLSDTLEAHNQYRVVTCVLSDTLLCTYPRFPRFNYDGTAPAWPPP